MPDKPNFERQHDNTEVSQYTAIFMAYKVGGIVQEVGAFELTEAIKYVVKPTEHFSHLTVDSTPQEIDNN